MQDEHLPNNEDELAELYQETIDHHHVYLEKLHSAFNNRCEKIGEDTKHKLTEVDESDEGTREKILGEEKALLDKTLAELKYAINKSNANARKKLEEIQEKIENNSMNLDGELAEL